MRAVETIGIGEKTDLDAVALDIADGGAILRVAADADANDAVFCLRIPIVHRVIDGAGCRIHDVVVRLRDDVKAGVNQRVAAGLRGVKARIAFCLALAERGFLIDDSDIRRLHIRLDFRIERREVVAVAGRGVREQRVVHEIVTD